MKRATLSIAVAFAGTFTFSACTGQDIPENKVPSVVVNALAEAFPTATDVEWEKQNGNFEAEFDSASTDYTVLLNATGAIVEAKHEITVAELPEAVQNAISVNYKDQQPDEVDLLEKDGQTFYQVELDGKVKETKLVFDAAGKEQTGFAYWD